VIKSPIDGSNTKDVLNAPTDEDGSSLTSKSHVSNTAEDTPRKGLGDFLYRPPTPPISMKRLIRAKEPSTSYPQAAPTPRKLRPIIRMSQHQSDALSGGTLLDNDVLLERASKAKGKTVSFYEVAEVIMPLKVKTTRLPTVLLNHVMDAMELREEVSKSRTEEEIARQCYISERGWFLQGAESLIKTGNQILALVNSIPDIDPDLKACFESEWALFKKREAFMVHNDRVLESCEEAIMEVEKNALRVDSALLKKEELLLEDYEIVPKAERDDESNELSNEDGTVSAHSATSWEDPIVATYYDKIGDVFLTLDYLHNLDTEHLTNLYARESERQQGLVPKRTDDEVYEEYFKERKRLLQDYITNKDEVAVYYALCVQSNQQVEPPNLPPEDFTRLDSSVRHGSRPRLAADDTSIEGGGSDIALLDRVRPHRDPAEVSKARVWSWIRTLITNENLVPEAVDENPPPMNLSIDLGTVVSFEYSERQILDKWDGGKITRRDSDPVLNSKSLAERQKLRYQWKRLSAFSDNGRRF